MTFNIRTCHNLNYEYVPNQTIQTIINERPDIIGINEMDYMNERNGFTDMPKIMAERIGYNYYFGKSIDFQSGEYGNMIMSRYPIKSVSNIPIPDRDDTYEQESRAIIKSRIDVDGHQINVFVTHYGLSVPERINAVNTSINLLDENIPTIFMGDLNCKPDSEELHPLYMKLKEMSTMLTFPSDKPIEKIDYIFTSNHFTVESSYVLDKQVSDHKPLIMSLNL